MSRNSMTLDRGIDQIKSKAVETADEATYRVAGAAGKVSDTLGAAAKRVDQPRVSRALKTSAKTVGRTEKDLRSKGARGLAALVVDSIRAHPGRYMALAIIVGLLFGRTMLRSNGPEHIGQGSVLVMEVKEVR
jgi:hypothetical protein